MKAIGVLTKEKILETVIYRMVNKDANADLLNNVPHMRIMDLAAAYYCILGQEDGYHAGMFINAGILRHYGIRVDELDAAARRNTEAGGFTIQELGEMPGMPEEILPVHMYVVTNRPLLYGASAILYRDYFRILAEQLGEVYILPSSVHELIVVPASYGDPADLQEIVKEINGSGLISRNEVLSNNVYRYGADEGLVCATLDGKKR